MPLNLYRTIVITLFFPGTLLAQQGKVDVRVDQKVTQLRHGVYAALLLAKANGRQLSGHRSRGRERPRAKRTPATYNNPQLLRPHRQVFPTHLPGPRSSAAHRRIQVKCNTNARESCAARENYWLSQQRKLLFPPAAKLIHFAKQYLSLHT